MVATTNDGFVVVKTENNTVHASLLKRKTFTKCKNFAHLVNITFALLSNFSTKRSKVKSLFKYLVYNETDTKAIRECNGWTIFRTDQVQSKAGSKKRCM